jgi:capsular polysaccharide biosynthesis protein
MEITNNDAKDEVEIDIREICSILLHKLWIIIIIGAVMAAIVGLINMYLITPMYESTTKIYVMHRQDESKTTISDLQTGAQLTQDYRILVTSRPVMEKVIDDLMLDMKPKELAGMIYVVNPEGTRIIEISVASNNATQAKLIADDVAKVSSEQMVNIMEMEKVNIVEYGDIATEPSSPDIKRSTVFGGITGVLITSIVIIVIHMLNDNIKTSEDIEKYLHITTLGIIPLEASININKKHKPKRFENELVS